MKKFWLPLRFWKSTLFLCVFGPGILASPFGAEADDTYSYRGKPVSRNFYQASLIGKDAELLLRNNRYQEAATRFEQALLLAPEYTEAEVNLGNSLFKLGKTSEAVSHFKHAVAAGSDIPEAWVNLAGAQVTLGQTAEAAKTYEAFLKKFPGSPYAAKIVGLLGDMKKEQLKEPLTRQRDPSGSEIASVGDYYSHVLGDKFVRWPSDLMPLRVYIENGATRMGFHPSYLTILKDSFAEWQSVSAGAISFQFVTTASKAQILCDWIDDPKLLRTSHKRGETQLSTTKDNIVNAKIRFLIATGDSTMDDSEMRNACLHEIGHALGFQGHSPNPNDIMFFSTTSTGRSPKKISTRDINTLKKFYKSDYFAVKEVRDIHEEGVTALERKDYNKAIEAFLQVIKERPDLDSARVNLGLCYAGLALDLDQKKRYDQAEKVYRAALEVRKQIKQPQLLNSAVQNFAAMLRDRDRPDEARELEKQLKIPGIVEEKAK